MQTVAADGGAETHGAQGEDFADWPLRPWILAGIGSLAGLLIFLLVEYGEDRPWPLAGAAFVFASALSLAFTIGPKRSLEPGIFALGAGLVMGGLAFQAVYLEDRVAGEEYAFAAGAFAVLLALPLFQAGFHRTRFSTDYRTIHFLLWTDAVSGAGAIAFTGLSWMLLILLDQLLGLVGIDLIGDLVDEEFFGFVWSGGAFGAALGVLRNNLKVIGALQSLALVVLSLLTVPLAAALIMFLVALIASGGQALWDAIQASTPVLLACAAGCFVLANAIIRQGDEARSSSRVLQIAALVLAAGILPLALFAAVSMGIRIHQYGLSPERLWALVAIVVATAFGLAYWVGLARGRSGNWARFLRQANLRLALMTCLLALFLALPILDFGAISARNQVARLEAGKVSPEEFDFAALRWDFGEAGREMLERLAAGEGGVAELAALAQQQMSRPGYWERPQRDRELHFRVQPHDPQLESLVEAFLRANPHRCRDYCVALQLEPQGENGRHRLALVEQYGFEVIELPLDPQREPVRPGPPERPQLDEDSRVEVRKVSTEYIFIDGQRLDQPIPQAGRVPRPVEVVPPAPAPPPRQTATE